MTRRRLPSLPAPPLGPLASAAMCFLDAVLGHCAGYSFSILSGMRIAEN